MIHDVTSPDKMLGVGVSLKKKDTTTIYFIQIERSLYFFYEYKSCLLIYWSSLKFNFFENEKISDVRFVFTSSICLQEGSCLIYGIYVYLCIVVSNTYGVVFLFCLSSSSIPAVVSFSGLSFLMTSSVFSNVY